MDEKIREFLNLPAEAMPRARFANESDSEDFDAWQVLRQSAETGESVSDITYGAAIIVAADRDGWRDGIEIL